MLQVDTSASKGHQESSKSKVAMAFGYEKVAKGRVRAHQISGIEQNILNGKLL